LEWMQALGLAGVCLIHAPDMEAVAQILVQGGGITHAMAVQPPTLSPQASAAPYPHRSHEVVKAALARQILTHSQTIHRPGWSD